MDLHSLLPINDDAETEEGEESHASLNGAHSTTNHGLLWFNVGNCHVLIPGIKNVRKEKHTLTMDKHVQWW